MKKILALFFLLTITSCDDGDFEIPSFQFDETVQKCGEYILYRTNTDKTEAIILVLNSTVIKNQVSTSPITIGISESNTQYRIFDRSVSADYFCQTLPPIEPKVLKNWVGISGSTSLIEINTSEEKDPNTNEVIGYKHSITLKNMRLQYLTETITYENFVFGTFTTAI